MSELMNCPDCHGQGSIRDTCGYCHGTGQETCWGCRAIGLGPQRDCTVCDGSGSTGPCGCENGRETRKCELCAATGYLCKDDVSRIVKERQEAARIKAEQDRRREAEVIRWHEAEAKKRAQEQAQKEVEANRLQAEVARKSAAKQAEQNRRQSEQRCVLYGVSLGFFDKLSKRVKHERCSVYQGPGS